jgi:hypothetical protein
MSQSSRSKIRKKALDYWNINYVPPWAIPLDKDQPLFTYDPKAIFIDEEEDEESED